jgi:hypothetical protein
VNLLSELGLIEIQPRKSKPMHLNRFTGEPVDRRADAARVRYLSADEEKVMSTIDLYGDMEMHFWYSPQAERLWAGYSIGKGYVVIDGKKRKFTHHSRSISSDKKDLARQFLALDAVYVGYAKMSSCED